MNKTMKQILKLIAIMIPSGIVGALTMTAMLRAEETQVFQSILKALDSFEQNGWIFHVIIGIIGIGGTVLTYFQAHTLLPKVLEDEDNEELDGKFEMNLGVSMVINRILVVLNFLFFTIAAFNTNELFHWSIIVFLVIFFFSTGFEIASIRLYQKKDPAKRGDPTSTKFASQWFESCDEAEKLMIYQSSYQSFTWTNLGFLFAIILVLLLRLAFGTFGLGTILVIGVLWMIHLLGYHLRWMNLKKNTAK